MTPSPGSAIAKGRILIRATNWVGDSVMTMPAVQRLREWAPSAHIALQCPAKLGDLWRHNPHLNEIITGSADRRGGRFDLAVIFPNSFRSAWECWRAGIPRRVGFAGHWRRGLLTDIIAEPANERPTYRSITVGGRTFKTKHFPVIRHQIHHYLDLVEDLGGSREPVPPRIWLAPGESAAFAKFQFKPDPPFIGIHAGAEFGPARCWLPERFAEVAAHVIEATGCQCLLFGGPGEIKAVAAIEALLRQRLPNSNQIVNVAGQTTLLELCELIQSCRVLLTNDTGPMHLAGALGTPVVVTTGSTAAQQTGPLDPRSCVLNAGVECSPCFLRECPIDFRCMNRITIEQVTDAVLKIWNDPLTRNHCG